MSSSTLALRPSFVASHSRRTTHTEALPVALDRGSLAGLVLGVAAAVLLTAGGALAMAAELERSFPAMQIGQQTASLPSSPSGKRGVVLVESGVASLVPSQG